MKLLSFSAWQLWIVSYLQQQAFVSRHETNS